MTFYFEIYICGGRLLPTTPSRPSPVIRGLWAPPFSCFSFLYLCLSFYIALPLKSAASRLLKGTKSNTEGTVTAATAIDAVEVEQPSTSANAVMATTIYPRVRRVEKNTRISVPSIFS